jgi:hypothetical protein
MRGIRCYLRKYEEFISGIGTTTDTGAVQPAGSVERTGMEADGTAGEFRARVYGSRTDARERTEVRSSAGVASWVARTSEVTDKYSAIADTDRHPMCANLWRSFQGRLATEIVGLVYWRNPVLSK